MKKKKKNDPKYKTELCKSFRDRNFCPYGNRCRFAHGKNELFKKNLETNKYKQKQCISFNELGYCLYGSRCNFKHGEIKLESINRSYYSYLLKISHMEDELNLISSKFEGFQNSFVLNKETFFDKTYNKHNNKRLEVFSGLTKNTDNSSTSVSSNESCSLSPNGFKGLSNALRFPPAAPNLNMNEISKSKAFPRFNIYGTNNMINNINCNYSNNINLYNISSNPINNKNNFYPSGYFDENMGN